MPATKNLTHNLAAFLDTIAFSELGSKLLAASDNGYNVLVGSTPQNIKLFSSYADHPRQRIQINSTLYSTAAGRYQLLARYFDPYKKLLNLPDFGPESQDAIAIQMLKEASALKYIEDGRIDLACKNAAHLWASLPGAGYGQHENNMLALRNAFAAAGGVPT